MREIETQYLISILQRYLLMSVFHVLEIEVEDSLFALNSLGKLIFNVNRLNL